MANTTRQNSLLVNQDWTKIYESFKNADFQSYDYQTLRKSMIDYLRLYYPEDFNDFVESSEYIALIDMIAFLGQSLAFRTDLNARENFIDTAERRDSVLKLARLVSYVPKRNQTSTGFLKFNSVQTTQTVTDSNGLDLTNLIIKWNDSTNINWYEQFVSVLNAAFPTSQVVGRPANSKQIGDVTNEEYNINLPPGTLPVYKFQSQVENAALGFEVVSPTSAGESYIYEVPPQTGRPLNILYKNDNLGNASNNTGFFFYFKQGDLRTVDFSFQESIPNNSISINFDNINNSDVWLYELTNFNTVYTLWNKIPSVNGVNIIYNNNAAKKSYQVNTRNNDQVDLVFGDGTFAAIPNGSFRSYFRVSTGLTYKITPDEMQNIVLNIPYVSRVGKVETLTISASLKYTIANAISRETLDEIKVKAPQQYYTQDRMVTGEDYNTFPYSNFNSISKVKAVNRTSSGVSRFLEVLDTTGRYSSTNIFAEDGILFREFDTTSFNFTWNTTGDINRVIQNQILPAIREKTLLHFYYEKFSRITLSDFYWSKSTTGSSSSTGYFENYAGDIQQIGAGVTGNPAYITENSIVVFSPGEGNYFNSLNEIIALPDSGILPPNGQLLLYVTIVNLVGNGSQGNLSNGKGPVTLSENVPTGAQAITVIPAFSNTFTTTFVAELIALISKYTEFGIRYDQLNRTWAVVTAQNLDLNTAFNQTNQGSNTGLNADASWLLSFQVNGPIYTVQIRGLSYLFESTKETKFYFDNRVKIFDPVTGLTVNDNVKVLKVNSNPETNLPQSQDISWYIYNQVVESDGYVDASKVLVTFSDLNDDGVPDNPDIFNIIVFGTNSEPSTITNDKYIYFQKSYGYNSFVTYVPVTQSLVNSDYATKASILPYINNYSDGQIFYTTTEQAFYVLTVSGSTRSLTLSNDYIARIGRQDVYFQYRHNAPGNRRLDPSPSNLIDLYILTKEYELQYRTWALDSTGSVTEPDIPSSESLRIDYSTLEDYKSVSDAIIYSAARFKPLFGNKARPELQATFKVIKNANINLSDSEIRSQVLTYINAFFATNNWDFGETFYFTELATYIQQSLAPNISSILIVPNSATQTYGSLQQISSEPNEILISCATVNDIEVITAITAAQLNLQNQSVNTIIN
jgi:hypothetical protein